MLCVVVKKEYLEERVNLSDSSTVVFRGVKSAIQS
jgi:hypothetical protein